MSAVQEAPSPGGVLYRIGRKPAPLAWPPWELTGAERFDDLERRFRTLYAATQRIGCFLEALAPLRPRPEAMAKWKAIHGPEAYPPQPIARGWHEQRAMAYLRLTRPVRLLDVRAITTCAFLRGELAVTLDALHLPDLDPSMVRGPHRHLTQAIAAWAHEHGFGGIAYRSRFDDGLEYVLDCWALFEGTEFEGVGPWDEITRDDLDLRTAASLHGLAL